MNQHTTGKFNAETIAALLKEIAHALFQTARFGLRTLRRMSWPALLGACVVMALFLTILPLAIVLFTVFLTLKLAVGAIVLGRRRARRHQEPQQ